MTAILSTKRKAQLVQSMCRAMVLQFERQQNGANARTRVVMNGRVVVDQ